MDKLKNNVFKAKFIKDIYSKLDKYGTIDNYIILGLILYISVLSIYTPRHIVSLINYPIVKLLILAGILYYGKNNLVLGLFMAIALLVTINLDNSLSIAESKLGKIKEGFQAEHYPPGSKDVLKTQSDDAPKSSKSSDTKKDVYDTHDGPHSHNPDKDTYYGKKGSDHSDSNDSDSDDSDSDDSDSDDSDSDDSDSDDSDSDDSDSDDDVSDAEAFYDDTEGFDVRKLKPSKNLDDGFKKLHKAIHELEGFISTNKK